MIPQELQTHEEAKFHIHADAVNYDDRVLVLNHYDSFGIFDRWGDIHPHAKKAHGIFHQGTRFIHQLELTLNKKKPLLLSSAIKEDNDILSVDLTNPDLDLCEILENSVHISRSQVIRNGIYYEEISLINYGGKKCEFDLQLAFGADFRDLFEIRGIVRNTKINKARLHASDHRIVFDYEGLDKVHRRTEVVFNTNSGAKITDNKVHFNISLEGLKAYKIEYRIFFKSDEHFLGIEDTLSLDEDFSDIRKSIQEDVSQSRSLFASIQSSNEQFNHWINRSRADLLSLLTETKYGKYPYAGVPWYNTAFGRDGIITAMEVLWIAPEIAHDALNFLANLQATALIPEKDAEPGKILHETRTGEMANTGEVPFKEYYGTIDATPLFIMLAGMYYERTNDIAAIKKIWPQIKYALEWIDNYGDIDGDGFVEYKHKAENGLTNQGWKDSYDSVMYEDGKLCEPPIALAEVQGYTYGAKIYAAKLAEVLDERDFAAVLLKQAKELKKNFNEKFWDEKLGSFILALDGNKQACRVISTNPGHCLFTGIVDDDKAPALVASLMHEQMFSGWGIRTLAVNEKRYNPMSYHNGSIWPHDNALIAFGFARYGFQKESLQIMQGLFDASLFIDLQRLPELFCGFERRYGEGPTAYPVACSPQAWSVAAVFLLLQSCLRIEINAQRKTIFFNKPQLPDYLNKITISNLRLGDQHCDFEMYRHQYDVGFNVIHKPGDWDIIINK